jgi:aminoglycoside phosphotransferase (APT) family kinase protein
LDQYPKTLIHGDFRMDNMLFGEEPEHDSLLVVDFQGPLKAMAYTTSRTS